MLAIYGCDLNDKNTISLNSYRHKLFVQATFKMNHNLATLPPTEDATAQHSLRTYFQVQRWLINDIEPTEWGWKKTKNGN